LAIVVIKTIEFYFMTDDKSCGKLTKDGWKYFPQEFVRLRF
jgi:hypothetical protein